MEKINRTGTFLGDEPQWSAAQVDLFDVQGLWGGRRIHAAGPCLAVVRLILPGMHEKRYGFDLGSDEWKWLLGLFVENDFLTIRLPERLGIPDEARPRITLINASGSKWTVSKWAGISDQRFDAVYSAMRHLETLCAHLEPTYSGPYESGA
jgi:hypothetical protein